MTKKSTIFSGGEAVSAQCVAEYKPFIDDSLVISADKGYKLAQAVGVKADIIMGDFDSAEKPVFDNRALSRVVMIFSYSVQQADE